MKRAALFNVSGLLSCLLSCLLPCLLLALAGCGQTGPLYMPTPAQRGIAPAPQPVTGQSPPSGMLRSRDEAQMQQPTPGVVEPRPGTR